MSRQSSNDSPVTSGPDAEIEAIEKAFVAQWTNFGYAPGGIFHESEDLIWSEAPVPQLPYNAILQTRLGHDAEERIEQIVKHFRQREVQFLWLVHPSATPANLAEQLVAKGLSLAEQATGMSLDLTSWKPESLPLQGPISYREVTDEQGLQAFEELMVAYWELPVESHAFVLGVSRWVYESRNRGARWVAYKDGKPVGKVYLSYLGLQDTAAIFGVYVLPSARGHGIASTLTRLAINRAAEIGRRRVVLHSSKMAVNIYHQLGFVDRCILPLYATTALHGTQPI